MVIRTSHIVRLASAVFAAALPASACKPPGGGGADVKTLDNFASGQLLKFNQCGGRPGSAPSALAGNVQFDDADKSKEAALRPEVASALSALPSEVASLFKGLGVRIVVSSSTTAICADAFKGNSQLFNYVLSKQDYVNGCFTYDSAEVTKNGKGALIVWLTPSANAIRHGLIRSLGMVTAQNIASLMRVNESTVALTNLESKDMRRSKELVAAAFVLDAVAAKRQSYADTLSDFFGTATQDAVLANIKNMGTSKKVSDLYAGFSFAPVGTAMSPAATLRERQRFEDFVFAETFDSFYCNDWAPFNVSDAKQALNGEKDETFRSAALRNTRQVLLNEFPTVHTIFADFDRQFRADSARIAASLPGAPRSGLSLAEPNANPPPQKGSWFYKALDAAQNNAFARGVGVVTERGRNLINGDPNTVGAKALEKISEGVLKVDDALGRPAEKADNLAHRPEETVGYQGIKKLFNDPDNSAWILETEAKKPFQDLANRGVAKKEYIAGATNTDPNGVFATGTAAIALTGDLIGVEKAIKAGDKLGQGIRDKDTGKTAEGTLDAANAVLPNGKLKTVTETGGNAVKAGKGELGPLDVIDNLGGVAKDLGGKVPSKHPDLSIPNKQTGGVIPAPEKSAVSELAEASKKAAEGQAKKFGKEAIANQLNGAKTPAGDSTTPAETSSESNPPAATPPEPSSSGGVEERSDYPGCIVTGDC